MRFDITHDRPSNHAVCPTTPPLVHLVNWYILSKSLFAFLIFFFSLLQNLFLSFPFFLECFSGVFLLAFQMYGTYEEQVYIAMTVSEEDVTQRRDPISLEFCCMQFRSWYTLLSKLGCLYQRGTEWGPHKSPANYSGQTMKNLCLV